MSDAASSLLESGLLLRAFAPHEPWAERGVGYRQWRLLKGEAAAKPTSADGAAAGAAATAAAENSSGDSLRSDLTSVLSNEDGPRLNPEQLRALVPPEERADGLKLEELFLEKRVGTGSFATVYRAGLHSPSPAASGASSPISRCGKLR